MAALAESVEQLGPLPWTSAGSKADTVQMTAKESMPKIQLLLRVSLDEGPALTAALTRMKALRSARKEREPVGVRVDPMDGLG